MTLTGLAVVRAPGFWRLARIEELAAMGLAPRRRVASALLVAVVATVLLAGVLAVGLNVGRSWLAAAAMSAEFSAQADRGGAPLEEELQGLAERVYTGLMGAPGPETGSAERYVTPEAADGLAPLRQRILDERISAVRITGSPELVAPGVYRVEVRELRGDGSAGSEQVGSSTLTVSQRQWLLADGVGSDWVVIGISVGSAPGGE